MGFGAVSETKWSQNGYPFCRIQIVPAPSTTQNQSRINDIRSVEILLMLRSSDDFFKTKKERNNISLVNTVRNKKNTDKYLREAIVATAHTRNIGISK